MPNRGPLAAGIAGLVLIAIYSWVMMATSGSADWAWLVLLAAIALLVWSARSAASGTSEDRGSDDA